MEEMDFDVFSELRKLVEEATSRKKRKKRTQSKEAGNSKKRKRLEEEDDESERDPRQVPKRLMSAIKKLVT